MNCVYGVRLALGVGLGRLLKRSSMERWIAQRLWAEKMSLDIESSDHLPYPRWDWHHLHGFGRHKSVS